MKLGVYSVYDSAAKCYGPPFLGQRDAIAIRGFTDAVNNGRGGNDLTAHPEDFALFRLGEFDDSTGLFSGEQPSPLVLCTALAVKVSPIQQEQIDGAA